MRKILTILFILNSLCVSGFTYYVSTTGNNANPGTIAQPWFTWQYGFNTIMAGDTLYIRGGVYTNYLGLYGSHYYGVKISGGSIHDGTLTEPIVVMAYPPDHAAGNYPILDGVNMIQNGIHFGICMSGRSYWRFKGLTVRNFKEYESGGVYKLAVGWEDYGVNNITYDQCIIHDCGNGFAVGGVSNNIYYINCDGFHNYDYYDNGGLAQGFNVNVRAGCHVYFDGCRAWQNSDDGFDFYGSDGYISVNNCWAWANGTYITSGNGAGFKMGDVTGVKESGVQRTMTHCLSFNNDWAGVDESMDDGDIISINIFNCTFYNNGRNINFGANEPTTGLVHLANNISYLYTLYSDAIRTDAQLTQTTNSWQGGITVSSADFVSLVSAGSDGARQSNGDLPDLDFLKLVVTSDMVDAGTNVGLVYIGDAPDIGAYEFGGPSGPTVPTITTKVITGITSTSAWSGGNITADGGASVTARGVCWSTASNPTTANSHTEDGTGVGDFNSAIISLEAGFTYYVRAYATNSVGTAYGNQRSFVAGTPPPTGDVLVKSGEQFVKSGTQLVKIE